MKMQIYRYLLILIAVLGLASCSKEPGPNGGNGGDEPIKEWTISGYVKGNDGKALEGVVVSDGLNCAKTDKDGRYYLPADLSKAYYVIVSTPSTHSAPVVDGHACYWKWLKDCTKDSNGKYSVDFTLNKISNPERFSIFIFADPQPRSTGRSQGMDAIAYHSLECCDDMYRDMKEYAATRKGYPVYGIGLGDIVHQNTDLLSRYRTGMATTGVTTYNVIGNHDQGHKMDLTNEEACAAYEAAMGPANYSFNLGNMHFLMLDNMLAQQGAYSDECATGLTDDIWEWIQNDLKYVSIETPLMVCAHSPMMMMESGSNRSGAHLGELRNLLSKYKKAYVWAGHTHTTFNYVDKSNPVIETHTVSRVTGALWTNEYLGSNGTPRGYIAFDYDNGSISWKFKPLYYQTSEYVGYMNDGDPDYTWRDWDYTNGKAVLKSTGKELDDKYQMQVFPPGTYGDDYLYVNVFLWDELWSTPRFTMDGSASVMKRVTEKDCRYSYSDWFITSFYHKSKKYSSDFVPDKNNNSSMFRVFVDSEHGSGTVTVKDRFGNEHKSSITW